MRARHASHKNSRYRDGQSERAIYVCVRLHTCTPVHVRKRAPPSYVCVRAGVRACVCVRAPMSVCFNSHSQKASVRRSANWPSYNYRGGCSQIGKRATGFNLIPNSFLSRCCPLDNSLSQGNGTKIKKNRIQNKGKIAA